MCEMHIRTLDFMTVLKDRLRWPDRPIAQQGIHRRGNSEVRYGGTHRTGPSVGTTIVRTVGGAACIDNAPDTSSMAMSRTFHYCTS
jgi:hypothetical protein